MSESKILIVEDDSKLAKSYADYLQTIGQCKIVYKGIEVLREFLNFKPHVMLLDITLEGEKDYPARTAGIAILKEIRNNDDAICRNCKVIVITGRVEPEYESQCRELGISEFFLKPTEATKVVGAVRHALRQYRNRCCTVFISSVMGELLGERRVVNQAIEDLNKAPSCITVDMAEKWHADPRPIEELYLEAVQRCDVFVLLLGKVYGEIIPSKSISAVENEYNKARALQKHITVFIKVENTRDPRMEAFIARIQAHSTGHLAKYFSNMAELRGFIQQSTLFLCNRRRGNGSCLKNIPPD